jgi:Rha family phage regulatory protein
MFDLTLIKQDGGVYIDSREVAEAIGKRHDHLLRDIAGYMKVLEKSGTPNLGATSFFVKSSYVDTWNRTKPCYLITKMGCEVCAHKQNKKKGVLFTAAYVAKFNEMEAAEREAEIKAHARPRLGEFNSAVKNVLKGMSYALALPTNVMKFLRGVYEPLGIEVLPVHETDYYGYFSATEIANLIGIYSSTGRPHAHAVSAIISKIDNHAKHTLAIPYGLVGVNFRYDHDLLTAVREWLATNNYPYVVPYQGFEYRIHYTKQMNLLEC